MRAADADLFSLASEDEARARAPEVLGMVRRNLSEGSPQRTAVEDVAAKVEAGEGPLTDVVCPTGEHEVPPVGPPPLAEPPAVTAVVTADHARPRDVLTVEFAGLIGVAPTVVTAVRRIQPDHASQYQFRLPLAAAVLKVPLRALSAVAGILLIKGAFVQRAEEALSGNRKP